MSFLATPMPPVSRETAPVFPGCRLNYSRPSLRDGIHPGPLGSGGTTWEVRPPGPCRGLRRAVAFIPNQNCTGASAKVSLLRGGRYNERRYQEKARSALAQASQDMSPPMASQRGEKGERRRKRWVNPSSPLLFHILLGFNGTFYSKRSHEKQSPMSHKNCVCHFLTVLLLKCTFIAAPSILCVPFSRTMSIAFILYSPFGRCLVLSIANSTARFSFSNLLFGYSRAIDLAYPHQPVGPLILEYTPFHSFSNFLVCFLASSGVAHHFRSSPLPCL